MARVFEGNHYPPAIPSRGRLVVPQQRTQARILCTDSVPGYTRVEDFETGQPRKIDVLTYRGGDVLLTPHLPG
jgi:hypothetical protein